MEDPPIYDQMWYDSDFYGAYQSFIEDLLNDNDLGGAHEYNEKDADLTFFLQRLLQMAPQLYFELTA